VVRENCWETI